MAEDSVAEPVLQFGFKKRSKAKANFRKKPATPPPASDDDSGFTSSDDDEGHRIKRRRKNVAVSASSTANAPRKDPEADQTSNAAPVRLTSSNDATKSANWYDEDLNAKNLLGSTRSRAGKENTSNEPVVDGTYKGSANYQSFIQKNPDAPGKKFGPMKAPTNVRTVTTMDFAPDVCKDYKQTGFCGFGDSCKFLHAREDYKQGWELDRDWESGTGKNQNGKVVSQRKGAGMADEEDEDEDDALLESIPFACIICKKSYNNPIMTKCGHYFCESCALQRYRKNPKCAACGAGTGGVFNTAKKLNALLDKKRERARKLREKAIAEGKDVPDEEEGGE
ncbi:Pre-mRNA-splicing factor cwc24 [Penicillium argentinense]|uniref:Pre-mRNA-splicing factor CWC24 n=1 Tax=Penicillium argentinense TaxID=1131581 RepID=A0A9W9EWC0_9EURO|nr:Pre-mRNA-splicing factor cwc24 [Penicillium argentinense]KAJ5089182.1 Pre-mRNA-splicing factor cwc24 [Penicillium argentinense]